MSDITIITMAIDTAIDDLTRKVLHHNGNMSKARLMALIRDHRENLLDAYDYFSNPEGTENDPCYAAAV